MSNVTVDEVNSNVSRLTVKVEKLEEKLDLLLDLVKRIDSTSTTTNVYYDNEHDSRWQSEHY